ncbi:phage antirepressor KilAC domain-containing protein [Endozoicomonas sp. SM1973]|uniref:Phage antirepressor KilAC domain-containing protein n=1 Tax=Spartinivicinus marinus TaxID=2994442 RepID=A0A853IIA0_9GAMM|nr:phage antirepressor [Spartinivicinus marinus]MCX4025119.1 phage antirepressor [Spartinivicinus marinus]NYZ69791.1 phage antirepressor KilAC domain-containing protein [Spartinivicinus marinus]
MNIIPFEFKNSEIRVIDKNGEPWFVAKDIAEVLGYTEAYKMTRNLDDDEIAPHIVGTNAGPREFSIINESGLYSAILKSRRPEARAFKKWVTSEVLPSIRKTGGYIAGQENDSPEVIMAKALQVAQSVIETKAKQLAVVKEEIREVLPKVEFHDQVAKAHDAITVGEAAKIIGTGRNRLFEYLRQIGWVTRYNQPYQHKIEQGLLNVKLSQFEHPDEGLKQKVTTLVTGKGLTKLQQMWNLVSQAEMEA